MWECRERVDGPVGGRVEGLQGHSWRVDDGGKLRGGLDR